MINGVGVVIFNDANVMTTDDIVTSCQRDRTPISPGSAGRAAGMLRIFVGQAYMVVIICDPVCKRGVVTFNDTKVMTTYDIDTSCHWDRIEP